MAQIRSTNTAAELALRRLLFKRGLRYRLYVRSLPGRPDLVFPAAKVAVFVDGDFWHGWRFEQWVHKLSPYWRAKIGRNQTRDAEVNAALKLDGWRVVRVWEHDLEENPQQCRDRIVRVVVRAMKSSRLEERGASG